MGRVVLLTGEREVGKTYLCQRVVHEAQRRGLSCAGVLSPACHEAQQKVGITLVDVATGEERPLASADDGTQGLRWGRYRFVTSSLKWGTQRLARATPCDLLVVDEVGPLEMKLGKGLVNALDVLAGGGFSLALVVARPELVEELKARLKGRRVDVLEVTSCNRDELPRQVLSILEGGRQAGSRFGEE
jgi:nucleoside-triphosphatase